MFLRVKDNFFFSGSVNECHATGKVTGAPADDAEDDDEAEDNERDIDAEKTPAADLVDDELDDEDEDDEEEEDKCCKSAFGLRTASILCSAEALAGGCLSSSSALVFERVLLRFSTLAFSFSSAVAAAAAAAAASSAAVAAAAASS